MGCWNETCAITRLPIFYQEPCVLVRLKPSILKRSSTRENPFGEYEDYAHVLGVHKGHYNDYGGLEEEENDTPPGEEVRVFCHGYAWDGACRHVGVRKRPPIFEQQKAIQNLIALCPGGAMERHFSKRLQVDSTSPF